MIMTMQLIRLSSYVLLWCNAGAFAPTFHLSFRRGIATRQCQSTSTKSLSNAWNDGISKASSLPSSSSSSSDVFEGQESSQPLYSDKDNKVNNAEKNDEEVERIIQQLESNSEKSIPTDLSSVAGGFTPSVPSRKYQPSLEPGDTIVDAITKVLKSPGPVTSFDLLDSRWNGNEVFRYETTNSDGNIKNYFVKMNRVEDASVILSEAVSLSALLKTNTIRTPKPLHIGKLPKVGDIGPGCFMVLEWMDLKPFGSMRSDIQVKLASQLADLHLSRTHDALHKGRFGFPTSNYLAITPLNNTWCDTWEELFARRLTDQLEALHTDKSYGRRVLSGDDSALLRRGRVIVAGLDQILQLNKPGTEPIRPSLIHGDLWIGNTGAAAAIATKEGANGSDEDAVPIIFDPACCFCHHEFELAIMHMFSGYSDAFWDAYHAKIPKAPGFERRAKIYAFYHYLNQLNIFGDKQVYQTCEEISKDLIDMLDLQP